MRNSVTIVEDCGVDLDDETDGTLHCRERNFQRLRKRWGVATRISDETDEFDANMIGLARQDAQAKEKAARLAESAAQTSGDQAARVIRNRSACS